MVKICIFGTHPNQFNGYSKVVYELSKCIAQHSYVELHIFGFQNAYKNEKHRLDFPYDKVKVYDAFANEEPKQAGFGISKIEEYVKEILPDVCIIYNDLMILTQCLGKLRASGIPMKIIAYIDQVYLCQKKEFIAQVNAHADFALAFTPYWEEVLKEQGITLPTGYIQHGFNTQANYPVPKDVARRYFNLNTEDFIILNLNRNQPRKRWDTCLKAFAEVVSRYPDKPIKMVIATAIHGGWNLLDIYERELKKRNVSIEVGMKHLILIDNPQRNTDEETNILYNVADIGINTCDGEGFGLCNFEQAAVGVPQVVPNLGGFKDFFDDNSAYLVEPVLAYYIDNTRDAVAGEALLCDYMDFVEGIVAYYEDPELRKRHGNNARQKIIQNYDWNKITEKLLGIVENILPPSLKKKEIIPPSVVQQEATKDADVDEIDITTIHDALKLINQNADDTKATAPPPPPGANNDDKDSAVQTLQTETQVPETEPSAKQEEPQNKKLKHSLKELQRLKKQIELVLTDLADNLDSDTE